MTDFTILAEGYVRKKQGTLYASSTVVLLQDSGLTIIIDPGSDRQQLRRALGNGISQPKMLILLSSHILIQIIHFWLEYFKKQKLSTLNTYIPMMAIWSKPRGIYPKLR